MLGSERGQNFGVVDRDGGSKTTRYLSTFDGNPVSATVGISVLDVHADERLRENAQRVRLHLSNELRKLAKRHATIRDMRGRGLFIGVELEDCSHSDVPAATTAHRVVNDLKEHGVLVHAVGPDSNLLKIRPPMPFSTANAAELLDKPDASLERFSTRGHAGVV